MKGLKQNIYINLTVFCHLFYIVTTKRLLAETIGLNIIIRPILF